jgi:hypothetical protein
VLFRSHRAKAEDIGSDAGAGEQQPDQPEEKLASGSDSALEDDSEEILSVDDSELVGDGEPVEEKKPPKGSKR